jgi:hypothetical protein
MIGFMESLYYVVAVIDSGFDNARSLALIVNAQKVFADERRAHGVVSRYPCPIAR